MENEKSEIKGKCLKLQIGTFGYFPLIIDSLKFFIPNYKKNGEMKNGQVFQDF